MMYVYGLYHVELGEHFFALTITTLQQEQDSIYQEMMDYKGKALKLQNEKQDQEKEKTKLL